MPAGSGMIGWSSFSGRTSSCWSGSPRRATRWVSTSSGRSCCLPRCGASANPSPWPWLPR
eukprot:541427-Alexandrium_andersonii.AAC.1